MDDICLSLERDGTHGVPTFEDNPEQKITDRGSSWENGTMMNASWEQNARGGNDSRNWGGPTVENVDAQDDTWGTVTTKAQNSTAEHMNAQNDTWGSVCAKAQTYNADHMDGKNDSRESGAAKICTVEPVDAGNASTGAAKVQTCTAQQEFWGNVAASPSDNVRGAAPSDGWDGKENRRDQRDNPGRLPTRPFERPQRPQYKLPAEAKKVLREIEPIVTMVRKIFRESCDGIRLPLEDEKFIIEKVLEHHPEKEKKVSGGIDHIMVNKHHIFQKSRCFYVVSSDGTHTDFSYNKCMDNYVRKKYAEHAELICRMHFKKCNRDRPAAVDGGAAPVTEAKAFQSTPGKATLPGPPAGT
uniref:Uncharacterized protein n=1 Tax=Triticum urartu TaxID=4572 RepID=A0A8R7URE5_TRIUA